MPNTEYINNKGFLQVFCLTLKESVINVSKLQEQIFRQVEELNIKTLLVSDSKGQFQTKYKFEMLIHLISIGTRKPQCLYLTSIFDFQM